MVKGQVGVRSAKGRAQQELTEAPLQLVFSLEEGRVMGALGECKAL